jgi:hypothetical protein
MKKWPALGGEPEKGFTSPITQRAGYNPHRLPPQQNLQARLSAAQVD